MVGLDLNNRGLASLMELQSQIVAHVHDIISRPMWWGISMEVGSKLPFSCAYFPYEHHLLRILAGPVSKEYFQLLVQKISGSVSHTGGDLHKSSSKTTKNINLVDHKSMWYVLSLAPQKEYRIADCDVNFYFRHVTGPW